MLEGAKLIGAGCATIALAGAGAELQGGFETARQKDSQQRSSNTNRMQALQKGPPGRAYLKVPRQSSTWTQRISLSTMQQEFLFCGNSQCSFKSAHRRKAVHV